MPAVAPWLRRASIREVFRVTLARRLLTPRTKSASDGVSESALARQPHHSFDPRLTYERPKLLEYAK